MTELLFNQVHTAFLEDLFVIGEQQMNLDACPDVPRVDFNQDAGGIQARRIIEGLIADEQASRPARISA